MAHGTNNFPAGASSPDAPATLKSNSSMGCFFVDRFGLSGYYPCSSDRTSGKGGCHVGASI